MTALYSLILCVLSAGAPPTPDHVGAVAPFLDGRTVAVCHFDLSALDVAALAARVEALDRVDPRVLAEPKRELASLRKELVRSGARDLFVVVSLADVPEEPPFVVVPLGKGVDAPTLLARLGRARFFQGPLRPEKIGSAIVAGTAPVRRRLRALKPTKRPDVARALSATRGVVQVVVVPPTDSARIIEEVMPTLPEVVGGGPVKPLVRGVRWLSVSLEKPPKLAVRFTLQATDADAARTWHDFLARLTKELAANESLQKRVPGLGRLLPLLLPKPDGDRLTLTLTEKDLAALAPLLTRVRAKAERDLASRRLNRVLAALLRYESAHKHFPASALYSKGGRPLLSWRVALLPYLGEAALYKEFNLDEPWDSPHNKKLLKKMPEAYRPLAPKLAAAQQTTILAPVGEATMFSGRRGLRIVDVPDGVSRTIFLIDADDAHAVEWTRPEDLKYDPKDPFHGLSARYGKVYLVGFVDGSVQFLPASIRRETLRALFTRNGGEAVDYP
jgi:hypothetical protein